MFYVVVHKLSQKKQCNSIILFVIAITTQILFQNLILTFDLFVDLRMKRDI